MGVQYWSMNQTTKKWELTDTYGGKLSENITQAVARDVICQAFQRMDEEGQEIVLHVHDEGVIEIPAENEKEEMDKMSSIMCEEITWAKGLPTNVDGFCSPYYKK